MDTKIFSNRFQQTCYWKASMDWPLQVAPADLPPDADVVVIGSGFTGLSAARSLAKTGARVVVLEKDEIGAGASSRNGGIVHPTLGVSGPELIDRFGLEPARELYQLIIDGMQFIDDLISEEKIDCHFNRNGAFEAAVKPQHLEWMRKRTEVLNEAFGHQTEIIQPADQSKFIKSPQYHGGWYDPLGATLHPARFAYGLAQSAVKAGAELYPHNPVIAIEHEGKAKQVTTPLGSIRADAVVLATNGYTEELVPTLRKRVIPLNITAVATEPLPDGLAGQLFPQRNCYWDTFRLFNYFQRTNDDRLVFGGISAFSRGILLDDARVFHTRIAKIFPELAEIRLDYAWDGMIALTFDRLPHLGQVEGIYYALGYNGDGVLLGCYLGDQLARMVSAEGQPISLSQISFPSKGYYSRRPWFIPIGRAFYGILDQLGI